MSNAMNQAMATNAPTEAVHDLLRQIAEENNLEALELINAMPKIATIDQTQERREQLAQEKRLADLRHAP